MKFVGSGKMSILSIVTIDLKYITFEHSVLRQRSCEISLRESKSLELCKKIALDMFEIMYTTYGAALSAPQVGIPLRLIVIDPAKLDFGPHVLINPIMVYKADSEEADMERCLSLPDYAGRVFRSNRVRVSAYNLNGQREEYEAEGLLARIFQHELDHLDGILYCDRLQPEDNLVESERAARRKAVEAISSSQGII